MNNVGALEISQVFGGYELVDGDGSRLPQNVASALGLVYAGREETVVPEYYYAKQVVNGTNHVMICKRIRRIDEIERVDYVRVSINIPMGVDGYKKATLVTQEVSDETLLPVEIEKIFESGTKYLVGVDYKPILYIGSQVVSGVNHHYMCVAKAVNATSEEYLARVILNVKGETVSIVEIQRIKE